MIFNLINKKPLLFEAVFVFAIVFNRCVTWSFAVLLQ